MNQILKSGFMATIGFLRSSVIYGYLYHLCRCCSSAAIEENAKNGFPGFPDEPDADIWILGYHRIPYNKSNLWVPISFLEMP